MHADELGGRVTPHRRRGCGAGRSLTAAGAPARPPSPLPPADPPAAPRDGAAPLCGGCRLPPARAAPGSPCARGPRAAAAGRAERARVVLKGQLPGAGGGARSQPAAPSPQPPAPSSPGYSPRAPPAAPLPQPRARSPRAPPPPAPFPHPARSPRGPAVRRAGSWSPKRRAGRRLLWPLGPRGCPAGEAAPSFQPRSWRWPGRSKLC